VLVFLFLGKNQHEGEIRICFYQIWEALAELYCFSFLSQEKMRRVYVEDSMARVFRQGYVFHYFTDAAISFDSLICS